MHGFHSKAVGNGVTPPKFSQGRDIWFDKDCQLMAFGPIKFDLSAMLE